MKKALSVILSLILIQSVSVVCAYADVEFHGNVIEDPGTEVFVTIADQDGNTVVAAQQIAVTDIDSDGNLTINDALYATHEKFYEGGAAAGYGTSVSEYGLGLTKLWGSTCGSYGYYVNNISSWALSDPVADGDYVAAFVYTDTKTWTDHYSYFDQFAGEAPAYTPIPLTFSEVGYDEEWKPVALPVEGAVITVDGVATEFVTEEDGTVTIFLSEVGVHLVSAVKEGKRLVAPVYIATVNEPVAATTGDADGNSRISILDATCVQRWLASLITEESINLTNADADRNGKVTILDATAIQRYLAGIISEL